MLMLYRSKFYVDGMRHDLTDADFLNTLDGKRIVDKTKHWKNVLLRRTHLPEHLIDLVARGLAIDGLVFERVGLMRWSYSCTGERGYNLQQFRKPEYWQTAVGFQRKQRREQTRRLMKYRHGWW